MRTQSTALLLLLLFSCRSRMPLPAPVVPDEPVEPIEVMTVTPDNLMEGSFYLTGDGSTDLNGIHGMIDSLVTSYIKVEIIDKALFADKQATAVNFWLEDTDGATKIDTVLTLQTRDSIVVFTDNTTEAELHAHYTYEGQLPVLNQFVVLATLYEEYGFMLIDKTTGTTTATYQAFPMISPDKKFIISLYANIYSPQSGDLSVDRIDNGAIVPMFTASFTNWMPQESFYGSDGWLYVSVNHPTQYWAPDGEVNEEHQFIRIKIL